MPSMANPASGPSARHAKPVILLAIISVLAFCWEGFEPWRFYRHFKTMYHRTALKHSLESRAKAVSKLTITTAPGDPVSDREREAYGPERHVCVVARGYVKHLPRLPYFFSSIIDQPYQHVTLFWVNTGEGPHDNDVEPVYTVMDFVKSLSKANNTMYVLNLNASDKFQAFPDFDSSIPDYGYVLTDLAIERLLHHDYVEIKRGPDQPAEGIRIPRCDYFLVTNSDNYYHPDFFTLLEEDMRKDYSIIGVDFISWHGGREVVFRNRLWTCGVDLGAVLVHRDNFEKWGLRYVVDKLRTPGVHDSDVDFFIADGDLIDAAGKSPGALNKIWSELLMIHN